MSSHPPQTADVPPPNTAEARARHAIQHAWQAGSDTLDLHGLGLKTLPPLPTGWALRQLDLSGNRLQQLPAWLWQLTTLQRLDLAGNRLREIDPGIGQLRGLVALDLSENRLRTLPPALAQCSALADLDLYDNQLAALPAVLLDLPALHTLDLAHNRLGSLPDLHGHWQQLAVLDLAANQLSTLPPAMGGLPALRRLDLSRNRLTAVDALLGLPALQALFVDNNQLAQLPPGLAAKAPLRQLSARDNPLLPTAADLAALATRAAPAHPSLRSLVLGGAQPGQRYFEAPDFTLNFALAPGAGPALAQSLDLYYKAYPGTPVWLALPDGSRADLAQLGRKVAFGLAQAGTSGQGEAAGVWQGQGTTLQFQPSANAADVQRSCEFAEATLERVAGVALITPPGRPGGWAHALPPEPPAPVQHPAAAAAPEVLAPVQAPAALWRESVHPPMPAALPDLRPEALPESLPPAPPLLQVPPLAAPAASPQPPSSWPASATAPEARPPLPPDGEVVDAAVFCPPRVARASAFLVQVFLYPATAAAAVEAEAQQRDPGAAQLGSCTLPIDVPRGTRIDLRLEMPTLQVDEADAVLVWRGVPTAAQFEVSVPADAAAPNALGKVRFAIAGVPAGRLGFQVLLAPAGTAPAPAQPRAGQAVRYHRAFVSYSSQDRAEVLRRVQAFKIAGISVFQDVLDLDPGERWERALYREIDQCDVFLLFWSRAAADSPWVGKEIDYAIDLQHGDPEHPPAIQPVPIEGPPIVPPPARLGGLHFNDALLAQIAAAAPPAAARPPDPGGV